MCTGNLATTYQKNTLTRTLFYSKQVYSKQVPRANITLTHFTWFIKNKQTTTKKNQNHKGSQAFTCAGCLYIKMVAASQAAQGTSHLSSHDATQWAGGGLCDGISLQFCFLTSTISSTCHILFHPGPKPTSVFVEKDAIDRRCHQTCLIQKDPKLACHTSIPNCSGNSTHLFSTLSPHPPPSLFYPDGVCKRIPHSM